MELSPGDRISLIREAATLLDKQEWNEIDLVLEQHSLPTSDYDTPNTKSAYITGMIKNSPDEDLVPVFKLSTLYDGFHKPTRLGSRITDV